MENTINPQLPFEKGVQSILKIKWKLGTTSPLVIRQGMRAEFKSDKNRTDKGDSKDTKGRKLEPVFNWLPERTKKQDDKNQAAKNQVADFAFQFVVEGESLKPRYHIPASSIRGALRAAAIERWVEWQQRDLFMLRKKKDESPEDEADSILKSVKRACDAMKRGNTKWMHILSLFGIAFNPQNDPANRCTWAGRLRVETEPLETGNGESIKYAGESVEVTGGPDNMQRTIGMRTPVDRITGGAKESAGGIHHWVEMPKGQTFDVRLTIANLCQTDIDLIEDWRTRIEAGFLTFGGLASVGRGEVDLVKQDYQLFTRRTEVTDFTEDPLEMFWKPEKITNFEDLKARQNKLPSHSAPEVAPQTPEGENHVPQS